MKIYGFFNSTNEFGDAEGFAIDENGKVLASHVSSNEWFSISDLGMDGESTRHHDAYNKTHPDGWEYEFVRIKDNRDKHVGLLAALSKHDQRVIDKRMSND